MTLFRPAVRSLALAIMAAAAHADTLPSPADQPYPGAIVLSVDASNTSQQIFRIRESIPAKPGKLTLLYPQWVPATHGPGGPLSQFAGLKLTVNGKPLAWTRDPLNVFAFQVEVPRDAKTVEAEYQYLSPTEPNQGRSTITGEILGVQWHAMALYPAGYATRRIQVQPSLTLPQGWQYATALETVERTGDTVQFKALDLETLVDSPLFAGRYHKRYDLDPGAKPSVHLNVFADSAEAVEAEPEQIELHRALIQQAYKLFNSQHYAHYDFLLALSDEFGHIGREHQQSSENSTKPDYFTDWNKAESVRGLLPHEFTHAWNGKFRRPAGQNVPNFNTPLQNSLLWVYEGQTQYWGHVLSARSGLIRMEHVRDILAATAARYDNMQGRTWRTLQDTTYDAIISGRRPLGWASWQRSEDYYSEGALIWLDVDTKIRELSGDTKSLDNFARNFFGIENGSASPNDYTFDDVVKALNAIQPYDWATLLRTRVETIAPAPLDGLARAGWKLVYAETPTPYLKEVEERGKWADFQYSLGFSVGHEGKIEALQWEGPGFKAGLASGITILAVNGTAYKTSVLRAAITAARTSVKPIELLVKKGSRYRTVQLDYHGGLKYPRLERIPDTPDRLQAILSPLK